MMNQLDLDVPLNEKLISDRQLTSEEVLNIKRLHSQRVCIEECMALESNPYWLRECNQMWMYKQRELQRAWKFAQDDKFIRFWSVPQCSCPKLDNEERLGYGHFVVNMSCLVHGN